MRLFEHEAKTLLKNAGFSIPRRLGLMSLSNLPKYTPSVLKAQVLFGNRKAAGCIHVCESEIAWEKATETLNSELTTRFPNPDEIDILLETIVPYEKEWYLAFRYDTKTRLPVLLYSTAGGSGIEGRSDAVTSFPLTDLEHTKLPHIDDAIPEEYLTKLIALFFEHDMTLLEINPLVLAGSALIILDAKIELEDVASYRHEEWTEAYPPRTLFARKPTEREMRAKAVDAMDHRGVAGATYMEFQGSIGVIAAGGGASLLAMDALLASSLKPANYTEHSGNPIREKVKALADVVLSQPNLEGLWVIGGHANFTDIFETLSGVMDAVEAAHLPTGFPIVIRRGGPKQEEGLASAKARGEAIGLAMHVFDSSFPITDTVAVLETAVTAFRQERNHVDSH